MCALFLTEQYKYGRRREFCWWGQDILRQDESWSEKNIV